MSAYVKPASDHDFTNEFKNWEWDDLNVEAVRKMNRAIAASVAEEIFKNMTLYVETNADGVVEAVLNSTAVEDAFFHFDLSKAVAGASERIQLDLPNYGDRFTDEIRDRRVALRDSLMALVAIVDADLAS